MSVANPKGEAQDVPNNPSLSATNKNPSSDTARVFLWIHFNQRGAIPGQPPESG